MGVYRDVRVDGGVDGVGRTVDCVVDGSVVMLFRFMIRMLWVGLGWTPRRLIGIGLMVIALLSVLVAWSWTLI